jgi:hypothetical protein
MVMYDVAPVQTRPSNRADDAAAFRHAIARIGRLCRHGDRYYVADHAGTVVVFDVAEHRRLIDDTVRAGADVARKRMAAAMPKDRTWTREAVGRILVAALYAGCHLAVDPVRSVVATFDDAWLARNEWTLDDVQRRAVVDAVVDTLVELLGFRHAEADDRPAAGITKADLEPIGQWIRGWLSIWINERDFAQTDVVNGLSDHMLRGISVARLVAGAGAATVAFAPHPAAEELLNPVRETETIATLAAVLPGPDQSIYRLKRPRDDDDPEYYTYRLSKTRRTDIVAVHPGPLNALMSTAVHSAPSAFITEPKTDATALIRTVNARIRRAIGPKDLEALCSALTTGACTIDQQAALFIATALQNTVVKVLRARDSADDPAAGILESTAAYMQLGSMQAADLGGEMSCALGQAIERMVVHMELSDLRRRVAGLEDGQLQIRDEGREGRGQLMELQKQLVEMHEQIVELKEGQLAEVGDLRRQVAELQEGQHEMQEGFKILADDNRCLKSMIAAVLGSENAGAALMDSVCRDPLCANGIPALTLDETDSPISVKSRGDAQLMTEATNTQIIGGLVEINLDRDDWLMTCHDLKILFQDHANPRLRSQKARSAYFRELQLPKGDDRRVRGWRCIRPRVQ